MAPKMHWFISEYNLNIILISPEAGQKGPRVYNLIVYEKINKKRISNTYIHSLN